MYSSASFGLYWPCFLANCALYSSKGHQFMKFCNVAYCPTLFMNVTILNVNLFQINVLIFNFSFSFYDFFFLSFSVFGQPTFSFSFSFFLSFFSPFFLCLSEAYIVVHFQFCFQTEALFSLVSILSQFQFHQQIFFSLSLSFLILSSPRFTLNATGTMSQYSVFSLSERECVNLEDPHHRGYPVCVMRLILDTER